MTHPDADSAQQSGNDVPLDPASILDGMRVKLWFCPVRAHRFVTWDGDLATCDECGRTNQDREHPGRGQSDG